MELPLYMVDAFTDQPFSGNQAAICWIGNRALSEKRMQEIASEINLAETAFIWSKSNDYVDENSFGLRWFSPTNEVALCGHATLAAAATLFYIAANKNDIVKFSTLSGDLFATKQNDKIVLNFPLNKPEPFNHPDLSSTIDVTLKTENVTRIKEVMFSKTEDKDLLIRMKDDFSLTDLQAIRPNFELMMKSHDGSVFKGIIMTTKGVGEYDFFSRYFAPWNGIPEDHVTGSAHTVLAPYWRDVTGKDVMLGRQCSKCGGDVQVKVRADGRVDIGGKSKIILKGHLCLPEEKE
ncbi:phenazine biosynthesis-like domain-containing protein 1 [Ciona intestinalis]